MAKTYALPPALVHLAGTWQFSGMYGELSRSARHQALAIALLAVVSLGAQFLYLNALRAEPPLATAWEMARYFTILTSLLVVMTLVALSRPGRAAIPYAWLAALTLSWVMSGAIYHLVLSDLISFEGLGWWADHGLHSAGPGALGLWWLLHGPKRRLRLSHLPIFALWPMVYGAYVLVRGAVDGAYPYPFVDLRVTAPMDVAGNLAMLLILFLVGGMVMIAIGRFADR